MEKHDDVEPPIDLTPAGMSNTDEELGEIENAIAQRVPARIWLTAAEYLNLGKGDCIESLSPEESIASPPKDVYNAVQGNEDSDHELQPMTLEFSMKDAL